jgi:carbamoyltransferase
MEKPRQPLAPDSMQGALLGPEYGDREIKRVLSRYGSPYIRFDDFCSLCRDVAHLLSEGKIIGWFQGRMEFGPRALGNRSILADPRCPEMQKKLNLKIKYREGFRPFAPAVLLEEADNYFAIDCPSPYMLLTAPVKESRRLDPGSADVAPDILQRLNSARSDIPAVTHLDYSARLQTVDKATNPLFRELLAAFRKLTNCAVLVNTSFNVRGEPIVCTPEDAWSCFMGTEMDYLVMGNFLIAKTGQGDNLISSHRTEFSMD